MKNKILALCDHALSTSGVGVQSRHLFFGLIEKNEWSIRQFGAAMKHADYNTVVVNDDLIIKPIDGFGNRDLIRVALATERPDMLFLFTDPRFFIWLFEMEDEVHQICPISWWHVWDNAPYPDFNSPLYAATDLINCHSHMTYDLIRERFPEKTNFIPHALPENLYFPISAEEKEKYSENLFGHKKDHFKVVWVNRNAKRKRPNDLLYSWKIFIDKLKDQGKPTDVLLLMHTDPNDNEGPNLLESSKQLGIQDNVYFSVDRLEFEKINILYNVSDACINISLAEGFGLSTLEAMQVGKPIIAVKTGGLTRQVVDHRDGSENGVALDVEFRSLVGSQGVPYIFEDYVSNNTIADAIMKLYDMPKEEREELGKKCRSYALSEFNMQKTIDEWHETMKETIQNHKAGKNKMWRLKTL